MQTLFKYSRLLSKIFFDFIPLILFLSTFYVSKNFYTSTTVLIVSTILLTLYTTIREKRFPYLAAFICFETTIFGMLTIWFKNPDFLQVRDTLYDFIVGGAIVLSAYFSKPIIKIMFKHMFELEDKTWIKLSYSWGFVFLMFGVFNEIVRRNFSDETWVDYKGVVAIVTVIYGTFLYFKFKDKAHIKL